MTGKLVRKINIPIPKMPISVQRAMEAQIKNDIDEWRKEYRKRRFEMLQQSPKKEKSRKERDVVKSENVARKSPSKEKAAADAKQWIKQFRKRQSELMLQSPQKRTRGS